MFYVYGLSGQTYQGRLETLPAVRAVVRGRPVQAIGTAGAEFSDAVDNAPTGGEAAAIAEYRKMLQVDVERGPLLHARQIMQRNVISAAADDDVAKAWRLLVSHRIHQAPVLDAERQLVGIVSERDLLTALNVDDGRIRDALARKVADVMTTPVVAADPLTDLRRVARVMLEHDVDGVPIVDENRRLAGFISRGDVLRAVVAEPPLSLWR